MQNYTQEKTLKLKIALKKTKEKEEKEKKEKKD